MRNIILFILSLSFFQSNAQSTTLVGNTNPTGLNILKAGKTIVDSAFVLRKYKAATGDTMVICLNDTGGIMAVPISDFRDIMPAGTGGGGADNQTLSVTSSGNVRFITISNGNTIAIKVADNDSSITNEIQALSISNDTIFLSDGGSVKLPDEIDPIWLSEKANYYTKGATDTLLDDYYTKSESDTRFVNTVDSLGASTGRLLFDSTKASFGDNASGQNFGVNIYTRSGVGLTMYSDTGNTIDMKPAPNSGLTPNGQILGMWRVWSNNSVSGLNTSGSMYWEKISGTASRFSRLMGTVGNNSLFSWSREGLNSWGFTAGANPVFEKDSIRYMSFKSTPAAGSAWSHFYAVKPVGGTGDFIQFLRTVGDTIARMDVKGNMYAKTFLPPVPIHISSDYTVNDTDSYIIVDASCTITLPSTYKSKTVKFQKGSSSSFSYTIQSSYNINGDGPLIISDERVVTTVFDGSAYWADYVIAPHDYDHVHTSDYQVKVDGVELPLHATAGSDTITCTGCTFPSTVVGMGMFIDSVKSNLSFSTRHMALVAKVTTRVNDTTVIIDKTADFTVRNTPGKYGTINWPYILQANAAANTLGINRIDINGQGILCLFPQLSDSSSVTAIPLRKSVSWVSEPGTSIFTGVEDQNFVDQDSMYSFSLFEIQASGDYVVRGIKAFGRNYSDQNVGGPTFVRQKTGVNINGSLGVYDCEAYGDTSVKSYTKDLYWGFGINLSARHDSGSKFILDARNNKFYCNTESFQAFDDYLGKECYIDGLYTQYGGSPKTMRKWGNHASIASGSHILTVDVDSFSFYFQNSQYDTFNRKYPFSIDYGAGTFTSQIDSIIDPHTAYVLDAAPADITDKEPIFYGPEGEDKYSNTVVYTSWKNVFSKAPHKYNFHKYNSTSAPDAKGSYYYNCVTDTTGMLFGAASFKGDLLSRHDDTIIVDYCKLYFTPFNQPVNVWANGSRFYGDFINYGLDSRFRNCEFDRFYQYAEDTSIIDNSRALSVATAASCYLKVNNSVVKYFPSPARTVASNVTDSNGHVFNTNLRTGATTDLVRVITSSGEEKSVAAGTFPTTSVLHDSLTIYKQNSDSTGASGYATNYKVDTLSTHIWQYATALVVGGGASWGTISGTLSDQTDLQGALDAKKANSDSTGVHGYVPQYQLDTAKSNLRTADAGKLNITDTSSMLSPYLRKVDTTAMLSPYLRKIDTTAKWVHISDSAYMLAPYLRKVDTTAMLSPYLRKIDTTSKWIHWTDTPNVIYTKYDVDTAKNNIRAAYQPLDADLTAFAGLTPTNDDIVQRKAGAWVNRTIAQLKTDLNITSITGNAGTATALQTARAIYGNNFDGTAALTQVIAGTYGGTGVNNGSKTITVSGNVSIGSSTNTVTINTTGNTNVTMPVSGTLATTAFTREMTIAISDETTAITTGTAKITFRMPFACTVTAVRASVNTVSSSGTPTFDINEGGTSILGTKLSIDANEKTSTTAASAATITDSSIADDAEMTIDVDTAGTGAKGAKIIIYYNL